MIKFISLLACLILPILTQYVTYTHDRYFYYTQIQDQSTKRPKYFSVLPIDSSLNGKNLMIVFEF